MPEISPLVKNTDEHFRLRVKIPDGELPPPGSPLARSACTRDSARLERGDAYDTLEQTLRPFGDPLGAAGGCRRGAGLDAVRAIRHDSRRPSPGGAHPG